MECSHYVTVPTSSTPYTAHYEQKQSQSKSEKIAQCEQALTQLTCFSLKHDRTFYVGNCNQSLTLFPKQYSDTKGSIAHITSKNITLSFLSVLQIM